MSDWITMNTSDTTTTTNAQPENVSKVITDGRTLRAMAKADKLTWPVPVHGSVKHKYVDEEKRSRSFQFKGKQYRIDYVDGCFFPFVFKINP